ncbi:hypothetical protein, partial [Bacillus cereus]
SNRNPHYFLGTYPFFAPEPLFFIDDIAKTVSTIESQANFDGVSRAGLTMKTSVIDSTKNMIVTSGLKNILQ